METQAIPAEGHDAGQWHTASAPTCTASGVSELRCTKCAAVLQTDGIPALGHSFGNWVVTTAPTCAAAGVETRYCQRAGCSHTETRPVSALGHDWVWVVTIPPTATTDGLETKTCSHCGAADGTRPVPAKGFDIWVADFFDDYIEINVYALNGVLYVEISVCYLYGNICYYYYEGYGFSVEYEYQNRSVLVLELDTEEDAWFELYLMADDINDDEFFKAVEITVIPA